MMIKETTGDPFNIMIQGVPKTMRQKIETHKLTSQKEVEEFHEIMAEGRDMIAVIPLKGTTYVMVRELVPSKVALA